MTGPELIPRVHLENLRDVVRARLLSNDHPGPAAIAALEGLKLLLGEDSAFTHETLVEEAKLWREATKPYR